MSALPEEKAILNENLMSGNSGFVRKVEAKYSKTVISKGQFLKVTSGHLKES